MDYRLSKCLTLVTQIRQAHWPVIPIKTMKLDCHISLNQHDFIEFGAGLNFHWHWFAYDDAKVRNCNLKWNQHPKFKDSEI